jgi:hypothetical protein
MDIWHWALGKGHWGTGHISQGTGHRAKCTGHRAQGTGQRTKGKGHATGHSNVSKKAYRDAQDTSVHRAQDTGQGLGFRV